MADSIEHSESARSRSRPGDAVVCTDRNLLFGIVALQLSFISRDALIAGMNAWVLAKHRALGRILVEQGALAPSRHELLERLVDEHLAISDLETERSLAAANGLAAVLGEQSAQSGLDVEPTLSRGEPSGSATMDIVDATQNYAGNPGSVLMRFSVLRPYARGGLGQVSVAMDYELNREVALKEIRPEHADHPESRSRFLLEGEVTGRLEDPGVVPVYGMGKDARGRPFYAMRFVKGQSLKEAIQRFHKGGNGTRRNRGEWNRGLRALLNRFVAVCNVVSYAHSRGVVHRDLKPSNVLLGPYGETLVVDWGLAKVIGRDATTVRATMAEATLRPASASGSSETLPGLRSGHRPT